MDMMNIIKELKERSVCLMMLLQAGISGDTDRQESTRS